MNFEAKLEKYAQVIVRVGVNLQPRLAPSIALDRLEGYSFQNVTLELHDRRLMETGKMAQNQICPVSEKGMAEVPSPFKRLFRIAFLVEV